MPDFPMTAVKSSQIAAIGYHDGKLRVRFNDRTNKKTGEVIPGALYEYDDMMGEHHAGLLAADATDGESVGAYFGRHIKGGGYAFRKIED